MTTNSLEHIANNLSRIGCCWISSRVSHQHGAINIEIYSYFLTNSWKISLETYRTRTQGEYFLHEENKESILAGRTLNETLETTKRMFLFFFAS